MIFNGDKVKVIKDDLIDIFLTLIIVSTRIIINVADRNLQQ